MADDQRLVVGIDLGGTRYRVAVSDTSGVILAKDNCNTEASLGQESVLARMVASVRRLTEPLDIRRIVGIGIGVPGPVDPWKGVVYSPPNLPGWEAVRVRDYFETSLQLPTFVGNDANLAALGESRFGAGYGVANLVYITVSTGIGGGIIADGRLLLGARGLAGEVGHTTIDLNGPRCLCGNIGCLEVLASGTAIARIARERIGAGETSSIPVLVRGNLESITAETVVEAARGGDPFAKEVMETAAINLGIGVVNIVHIFNPTLVLIGGGVSNAGDLLFVPVRNIVQQRVMPDIQEGLSIIPAALGDDAGLMGAIALVSDINN